MPDPRELLDRLDTRHNELILKLDELNAQIEATLAQFAKSRGDDSISAVNSTETTIDISSLQSARRRAA
jgi:hypothetical protein